MSPAFFGVPIVVAQFNRVSSCVHWFRTDVLLLAGTLVRQG